MKILICDNVDELGEDFVARCKEILPEWRREQMMGYKHLRGQVQCAVAWILVEKLKVESGKLKETSCFARNERWVYNEHGKPYFEGRNDLFFSVSHCRGAVAVAVHDEEVGVDIEEISRYRESLENYVLSEEESREYGVESREYGVGSREGRFIEIWTKKEAAFKYYGTGITHEIKDILKRGDVDVYSKKIGDKFLSVATGKRVEKAENVEKRVESREYGVEMVGVSELLDFIGDCGKC